jgi:hypothetical protein
MSLNATAVVVNYNTPELLARCVISIRKLYEDLIIIVVDGSSEEKHIEMMGMIEGLDGLDVHKIGKNITHGPGLAHGMAAARTKHVLTMDSDAFFTRRGFLEACLEAMDEKSYGAGVVCEFPTGTPYLHPFCSLINMEVASDYPLPTIHGAPMINTMREIKKRNQNNLINIENINEFVKHQRMGTRGPGTYPHRH